MRKVLSCLLVMLLFASCLALAVAAAAARQTGIPGDTDEDDKLTEDELVDAILSYMLEEEGHLELNELRDAAHVYVYWDGEPRTIVDSVDRTVTIYKPIKSVVCTFPHHIEALRTLKVSKDTIVGVPSWLDTAFSPEFADVTCIGFSTGPDLEAILEIDPDIVLLAGDLGVSVMGNPDEDQEQLEAAGETVIRFTFNQVETIPEEIEKLGYVFEKEDEAEEFIDWYETILNSIEGVTSEVSDENKPKVYSEYLPYQIAPTDDEIIALAGGKDIFAGIYGDADKEYLVNEDPSIIIRVVWGIFGAVGGYGLDVDDTAVLEDVINDDIMCRSELQNVTAVKNESVYIITSHIWTYLPYSGCRPLIGLCYLAKWFHPELFPDLDPKAVHQEYLTRFQELDIDLDDKGVFVYPEKKG